MCCNTSFGTRQIVRTNDAGYCSDLIVHAKDVLLSSVTKSVPAA